MPITRTLTVASLDAPITTGRGVLVAGTVTIVDAYANHTANARTSHARCITGPPLGELCLARSGDDLVITSENAGDTSTVDFIIIG